jgi:hypothetical protein
METEEISETLVFRSTLTRLIAQKKFVSTFIGRESFKSSLGFNLGWFHVGYVVKEVAFEQ